MLEHITPEEAGIASDAVREFYAYLEENGINLHSVLMMRGEKIFSEVHWAPFNGEKIHRMYSVSKSFVSVAIGLLLEDGLIRLDDPIALYFRDELPETLPPYMEKQTIRDMLVMNTSVTPGSFPPWFYTENPSRAYEYFRSVNTRRPGTTFVYDSTGSYLLGALVQRVTGKDFFTFLRERILDRIGFSKEAVCLKTPDGNAWGDSAIVCKPSDLLRFARFCMNYGTWEGERLMDEAYLRAATSKQVDSAPEGLRIYDSFGYGYQFWMTYDGAFSMNGMGGQFAICVPERDLIFVCTADNQGNSYANHCVFRSFFDRIARKIQDQPLPENPEAYRNLQEFGATRKLSVARGEKEAAIAGRISGKTYRMEPNRMGLKRLRVTFEENGGVLFYTNAQGDKELRFGMQENVFGKFPEYGYSDGVGGMQTENGFRYDCAASAGWVDDRTLQLRVQIIDRYFGNLIITLAFCEGGEAVGVRMIRAAEAFLDTYEGFADGTAI